MIGLGWTDSDLNAMNEAEFGFWYDETVKLEEAKADAIRKASSK
ncbi:hypothetical protein [Shinella sp.]|jgi:hypothetical protein